MKDKRFVLALVTFLFLNLAASIFFVGRLDRFAYPFRTWPFWLVKDLHNTTENFNVALLGSSLMLGSIYGCDANYLKMPIDSCTYHRSTYLNDELEKTYGGKFNTFNLATPGQVPSDAYLLLKTMLALGQKPAVVIYGIAPRDFMDNRLDKPNDTETFHYLKRLVSTTEIEGEDQLSQFDRFLFDYLPLYRSAVNFKIYAGEESDQVLAKILPRPSGAPYFTYWKRIDLLPQYKAGELYPGAVVHVPTKPLSGAAWKRNNVDDYIERYRHPNEQMFTQQLAYLSKLLELAKSENIKVVLVNMPLSPINIMLLGSDRYQKFEDRIARFSQSKSISFLNLSDQVIFPNELFEDSAHLNAFGGKLFIDRLVNGLSRDTALSATLKSAGLSLAHEGPLLSTRGVREIN